MKDGNNGGTAGWFTAKLWWPKLNNAPLTPSRQELNQGHVTERGGIGDER